MTRPPAARRDAKLLRRIQLGARAASACAVANAIGNAAWYLAKYAAYEGAAFSHQYFWGGLAMCAVSLLVVPTLVSGWWLGSRLASALARTHISAVVAATPPSDAGRWDSRVVRPCLRLGHPLGELSRGYARGLASLVAGLFSLALLCFVQVASGRIAVSEIEAPNMIAILV